jgi:hypothetical protein
LEKEPIKESRILFEHESQNAFFQRLTHGGSRCLVALKVPKNFIGAKSLFRKLFHQMDNCVKDNKNCQLPRFLFFLTTRKVFEEVQLGFLVVGKNLEM